MLELSSFIEGIYMLLDLTLVMYIMLGMAGGLIAGAIPGFTATMAIGILIPITYAMTPLQGLAFLAAVYTGGVYGGSIPAILLNAPGTPSSITTCFDGYPLTKKGKSNLALGVALGASLAGGIVSILLLLFVMYPIAVFALRFGPPEMFMVAIFGLSIIATIRGESISKGLLAGFFGILIGTIGIAPTGAMRGTYGYALLLDGIPIVPVLIGIFAFSELFNTIIKEYISDDLNTSKKRSYKEMFDGIKLTFSQPFNFIRSTAIGVLVGAIPAAGGSVANLISYNECKRAAKNKEEFGKGSIAGLVAAEASNNGSTGGALITMFALGIPGSSSTAMMLGALMLHGLRPGPGLFVDQMHLVYGIILSIFIAKIFMFLFGIFACFQISRFVEVETKIIVPIVALFCMLGSFAIRGQIFDAFLMVGFGIIGYFIKEKGYPPMAVILGVILGPIADSSLIRTQMRFGSGFWTVFFTRPISLILVILTFLSILYPYFRSAIIRNK